MDELGGGVLVACWRDPSAEVDDSLLPLAERFAGHVAVALSEAGKREALAEVSLLHGRLEASLLPRLPRAHGSLTIAARYLPAEQRMMIGGDFVDVFQYEDGRLGLVIGDVTGHGPDAAALGATLRAGWRALLVAGLEGHEVLTALEGLLQRERSSDDMLATVCLAWLNPRLGEVCFANAGHLPPLLVSHDSAASFVELPSHLPLGTGLAEAEGLAEATHTLPEHWGLLFYTDGLVEGRLRGTQSRFGLERLANLLGENGGPDLGTEAVDRVVGTVRRMTAAPLADDVALVAVSNHAADAAKQAPADSNG
ncbi:MAG TPA: PP2C family protein-serine/threonine phosphatase [Thermoleophilia bacterium]|nr:PP2C family protein-serine/threonine phosphatase [Thermoleophilia bacterium]